MLSVDKVVYHCYSAPANSVCNKALSLAVKVNVDNGKCVCETAHCFNRFVLIPLKTVVVRLQT